MDSLDMRHLPALLRITYGVLAQRVLLFLALSMAFGLFCWALATGTWLSLALAATFAVLVFLPILLRSKKETDDAAETS